MSCNCDGQYQNCNCGNQYQHEYRQQPQPYGAQPHGQCPWPRRWVRECRWVCRHPWGHGPGGMGTPRPGEYFYTDEDYYY